MKITERQLRTIISEEIGKLAEESTAPMSAGQKLAAKAGEATSLSGYETAASKVMDAAGLAALIKQTVDATPLKEKTPVVQQALRMVLKQIAGK